MNLERFEEQKSPTLAESHFWIEVEDITGYTFFDGGPCGSQVKAPKGFPDLFAVMDVHSSALRWPREERYARALAATWIQHPMIRSVTLVEVHQKIPGESLWEPTDPDYE